MTTLAQCPDAPTLAEAIAQRCAQATLHGARWQACCPSHDDTDPSLSITASTDKVLLTCHAGCATTDVVAALGLTLADLFVETPSTNGHRLIVKVYPYHDAHGHVVHETVRYEPKGFRQRRPDPVNPGAYCWDLKGIEPVLYSLPAVLQTIQAGETIHLAEGEKDAETLQALGLVATTVPMGAKYWRPSYTETLTGADVVVWPDNDAAGRASITKVQRALTGKAKALRIVQVPAPHNDVSEWIQAGGTRAELDALVQAQTPPAPLAASLVSADTLLDLHVAPRKAYTAWLRERSLTMVYGPSGVGKTMFLMGLARSLATPTPFLPWAAPQEGVGVLYIDGEMSLDDLKDRFRQLSCGHRPERLKFLPSELVFERSDRDLTLTAPADQLAIDAMLEAQGLQVLILDNISCLFPGIDESRKQDWEPIAQWLIRLRHRGMTVLVGHHAGKNGLQRGTSGREDALNTIIALTRPPGYTPEDGCHFHLRFEKSRGVRGPAVAALDVRVEDVQGQLIWTCNALEATRTAQVKAMLTEGIPAKVIADELTIQLSYVYRLKKRLDL
jgi:AAA domain